MPTRSTLQRGAVPLRQRRYFVLGAGLLALTALGAPAQDPRGQTLPAGFGGLVSRAVAARPVEPSVFGTIALPAGTTPTSARWTRIMNARVDRPALAQLTGEAVKLDRVQQAAFVQSAVNGALQRGSDCRNDDGYWATAEETLARRTGDCVDIAVAKMEALRRLGFAQNDLYLTTGRAVGRGFKAALLVRIGDRFWLLDDRSERMIEAATPAGFDPALTYGVGMTWAHGRRLAARID
jgi:predicted transglutaminase-like cysteine proteinase